MDASPQVTYFFTTFPKESERFLQREVRFLGSTLPRLRLVSIHQGGPQFEGRAVLCFSKWKLLHLLWRIPYWLARKPSAILSLLGDLFRYPCPSFLNFQETLLGLAYALVEGPSLLFNAPRSWHHATWATTPASAALALYRLYDKPFSMEAHAYDIFVGEGDWLIRTKISEAAFIRTSTEAGRQRLLQLGADPQKLHLIRRGMENPPTGLPPLSGENMPDLPLHLLSVGRFVPKKGLPFLLQILEALDRRGLSFEASIVGDGPLRSQLEQSLQVSGLTGRVHLPGFLSPDDLEARFSRATFLLFTGEVGPDGNRDGLPNVIPEAMASGTVVLTTDVGATTEAITDRKTGRVLPSGNPEAWVEALLDLQAQPESYRALREEAHGWVHRHYRLDQNLPPLFKLLKDAHNADGS